jgi:hypothetical protein
MWKELQFKALLPLWQPTNSQSGFAIGEPSMAERNRNRRNTLERRCLPKILKRMFKGSPSYVFRMLEKVKK